MTEKIETIVEKDIYDLAVEAYMIMLNKNFNYGFVVAENLNKIEDYYGFRLDKLFNTIFEEAYDSLGPNKSIVADGCAKTLITFCENIFYN